MSSNENTNWLIGVLIVVLLNACVTAKKPHYQFNQKTCASAIKSDIGLLKKILEANHPSLYWYTSKDSLDNYFNTVSNSIKDSLSEVEARNKIASILSKIRCGHTSARFSKSFGKQLKTHQYPHFPLSIKTWGDSMVVIGSFLPKDSIFKRGTIITSINGRTNKQILDSLFNLISTDGYGNNFKSQLISGSFPSWYRMGFGIDSSYTITYIDSLGVVRKETIGNYSPIISKGKPSKKLDKSITIEKKTPKKQTRKAAQLALRSMTIDTINSTAYLRLTTFSSGNLRSFFKKSFSQLAQTNTKNLIIDLRENTGGYLRLSNLLARYISDKPFKNGDTILAKTRSIQYPFYVRESIKYWVCAHLVARKQPDGYYHYRGEEKSYMKPKTSNHFDGKIYILQGGYTFSAASLFIASIKGQSNVTTVGEETGGGSYGNTAMYLPTIVLPETRLRVTMPMFRLVINANNPKNGRGILPDVFIPPSSVAIKNGIDLKLATVKEMIKKGE